LSLLQVGTLSELVTKQVGDLSSQIPRALLMQVGAISNDGDEEWDIEEDGKSEAQSEPADENSNEGEDEEP
jgi:hypothetical protein